MADIRNSPSMIGIRSIQERIRAMNETLDSVEQRHRQEVSLCDSKQLDLTGDSSGPVGSAAPLTSSPPAGKRSSVVDLWRMREMKNASDGGVVVASVSKKKSSISEETFRNLLKSPNDTANAHVSVSSPLISKNTIERFEEKKVDDDCAIVNSATSSSAPEVKSPTRIVPPTSPHKAAFVKGAIPRASQSVVSASDLTILPATSSVSNSSAVDPEKRTSKIASIWEKMSNSYDSSSTVPSSVLTKDIKQQPPDEEKSSIKSSTISLDVKDLRPPPKRHSVVDIWNNRSSGKAVDCVAANPPPKALSSVISQQQSPPEYSTPAAADQCSISPPKECSSDSKGLTIMSHETSSEGNDGIKEVIHHDDQAPNTLKAKELFNNSSSFGTRSSVVDRYKFHSSNASKSSDMKTVSPVVSSIVKEHASRIPIGLFKNSKVGHGNEALLYSNQPQIEKKNEMTSSVSTARSAIECAVTSVVDKHIEQRGNKVTDRWTLNKALSSENENFSADTLDVPKFHGKVTDRWKPHSSSFSDSGSKFDKATVAGLLKLHSGNTPFGRARQEKDCSDQPKVMQKVSHCMNNDKESPLDGATPSSYMKQEAAVSLNLAPEEESTSKDSPLVMPSSSLRKVNVADRWKKRLDEAKVCTVEQEPKMQHVGDALLYYTPSVSNRSTPGVKNSPIHSKECDAAKQNGLVDSTEKSLSNEMDQISPEYPVKPSLSVIDYAAKLRSARVPPSFLLGEKKDHDDKPSKGCQARSIENTLSVNVDQNQADYELSVEHRDESFSSRIESTIGSQDPMVSSVQLAVDASPSDLSRSNHLVATIKLPDKSLKEKRDDITSSGVHGDSVVVKATNSSAFAPWPHVTEMSNECDFSEKNYLKNFTPPGHTDIVSKSVQKDEIPMVASAKRVEPSYQLGLPTEESGSNIATIYSPKPFHTFDKVLPKDVSARQPISLSTKKLASDRALNKKRLQQYRGKGKKAPLTKESPSEGLSSDYVSPQDVSLKLKIDKVVSLSDAKSSQFKETFDYDGLLRPSGSSSERICKPDVDEEMFAAICSTSSTNTSSSPLASKAEKMLQDRRKRSYGHHRRLPEEPSGSNSLPVNIFNCYDIDEPDKFGDSCVSHFAEDETGDRQPRLFTRYNTSSRFMDVEASDGAPAELVYDSETVDSSFNETETTGSNSGYYGVDRQHLEEKKEAPRRRKVPMKDPPGQMSDEKSVNLSSQSAWDSDWGGSINMVSLDFNKIVSAVDEQVAAFRDFVGAGSKKQPKRSKKKANLTLPPNAKAPPEVEDVAIEVEYLEDSFDENDPRSDLGFCTVPIDDVVRGSLDFSSVAKANISRKFSEPCSGTLPTGEPSYERKPTTRKHSQRNGYV